MLDQLFHEAQYTRPQTEKERLLLPELVALTQHHTEKCPSYAKIVRLTAPNFKNAKSLDDLPYLPTGLFKTRRLQSVPDTDIRLTLTSSGTTGRAVSQIAIDDITAKNQARGLAAIMREAFGSKRLPMLIIDSEDVLKNHEQLNARSAGVLGMMVFGHDLIFALNSNMQVNETAIDTFLRTHSSQPFVIFGFTFMVWRYFFQVLRKKGFNFSNGILVHSGGWKKMENEMVDNTIFRQSLTEEMSLTKIYNFYGMAEQIGTAFLEGEDGFLYPPAFGDVLIRDPHNWQVLPDGQEGIIQVFSLIPQSYPGHSLLTEDRGVIVYRDKGISGRMGKALKVLGRAPRAELRGCSDVHAFGAAT